MNGIKITKSNSISPNFTNKSPIQHKANTPHNESSISPLAHRLAVTSKAIETNTSTLQPDQLKQTIENLASNAPLSDGQSEDFSTLPKSQLLPIIFNPTDTFDDAEKSAALSRWQSLEKQEIQALIAEGVSAR